MDQINCEKIGLQAECTEKTEKYRNAGFYF